MPLKLNFEISLLKSKYIQRDEAGDIVPDNSLIFDITATLMNYINIDKYECSQMYILVWLENRIYMYVGNVGLLVGRWGPDAQG